MLSQLDFAAFHAIAPNGGFRLANAYDVCQYRSAELDDALDDFTATMRPGINCVAGLRHLLQAGDPLPTGLDGLSMQTASNFFEQYWSIAGLRIFC
jgi:hypothetical protein